MHPGPLFFAYRAVSSRAILNDSDKGKDYARGEGLRSVMGFSGGRIEKQSITNKMAGNGASRNGKKGKARVVDKC